MLFQNNLLSRSCCDMNPGKQLFDIREKGPVECDHHVNQTRTSWMWQNDNLTMVVSASKVMTTSKGEVAEEGIAIFVWKRSLLETKSRFNKRSNGLQWIAGKSIVDCSVYLIFSCGDVVLWVIALWIELCVIRICLFVCLFVCINLCLSLSENWMHLPLPLPQWCPPPCTLSYALPLSIIASQIWGFNEDLLPLRIIASLVWGIC